MTDDPIALREQNAAQAEYINALLSARANLELECMRLNRRVKALEAQLAEHAKTLAHE